MLVYKIINKINGKSYIGQTIQPLKERWRKHLKGTTKCHAISSAIQKYGKDNFEIKILVKCNSKQEMNHREAYYIKLFNTLAPNGYNLKSGGSNQFYSQESRKKMSDAMKNMKNHWFHKKGIENHNFGRHMAEETKRKLASLYKGKTLEELYGIEKAKIMKEKQILKRKRPIICNETGNIYPSIKEAAESFGVISKAIRRVLTGERNHYKGFTFSYREDRNV